LDGVSLQRGPLRIVRGPATRRFAVVVTPRIGISRAAEWPLRFVIEGSPWVSAPR
jgi:DNA-3-methyladenine glycosylase